MIAFSVSRLCIISMEDANLGAKLSKNLSRSSEECDSNCKYKLLPKQSASGGRFLVHHLFCDCFHLATASNHSPRLKKITHFSLATSVYFSMELAICVSLVKRKAHIHFLFLALKEQVVEYSVGREVFSSLSAFIFQHSHYFMISN